MDPLKRAQQYYDDEIRRKVKVLPALPRIKGFLATDDPPAHTYARYMRKAFQKYGIAFDLCRLPAEELPAAIAAANEDEAVHGIFVFYPIFGGERDRELRNSVVPEKDIEGLSLFWLNKLYENERFIGRQRKALLPCTPLAVVKILEQCLEWKQEAFPLRGKYVTIFNRSEVVGRPLAGMLSNDGAEVFSFDINSVQIFRYGEAFDATISRAEALKISDVVITGVPSASFPRVSAREIKPGAICINFSSEKNFADDIRQAAGIYVPRIGPVTVLMCVRNALRLFKNFHLEGELKTPGS